MSRGAFHVIRSRHVTEKASVLAGLESSESNVCVRACRTPKAVFLVDPNANKAEIKRAVEEIYSERSVRVLKVNTVIRRPKKRRVRGRLGFGAGLKKAIVTFAEGDRIDEV